MTMLTRTLVLAGVGAAVTATSAGAAHADTNSNTQDNTQICNVAIASPGAEPGGCGSTQIAGQEMTKNYTTNVAVIDYIAGKVMVP